MMEFWIIRHKPSGGFLPELSGVRAGYTHTEPQTHGVPRLFTEAAAAKRALTWWLKGTLSVSRYRDDFTMEYDETWHEEAMPDRKIEDMEVVSVLLKL